MNQAATRLGKSGQMVPPFSVFFVGAESHKENGLVGLTIAALP